MLEKDNIQANTGDVFFFLLDFFYDIYFTMNSTTHKGEDKLL